MEGEEDGISEKEASKLESNELDGKGLLNMAKQTEQQIYSKLVDTKEGYGMAKGAAEKLAPKIKALEGKCAAYVFWGDRSIWVLIIQLFVWCRVSIVSMMCIIDWIG